MIRFNRKLGIYPEFSSMHPCSVRYKGITYGNSEAAFQAQKTGTEIDIRFQSMSGFDAKKYGKKVPLRGDWEDVKYGIMKDVVLAKFQQNTVLWNLLDQTGNEWIIEDNTWHDCNWGMCTCSRCSKRKAKNMLGLAIMEVRAIMRGEPTCDVTFILDGKPFTLNLWGEEVQVYKDVNKWDMLVDTICRHGK